MMKKSIIYLLMFVYMLCTVQSNAQFTILNQPPPTNRPYQVAYYNQRLPSSGCATAPCGPMTHLMPNSDSMVANFMQSGSATDAGAWNSPGSDDGQHKPLYFGKSTDPVYQLSGCVSPMTALNGTKFHAPSGAMFNQGSFDKEIVIWDQTTNITIGLFGGTCTASSCFALPASSGTLASPTIFTVNGGYCSSDNWVTGPGIGGGDAASTAGLSPFANIIRLTEIVSIHHINHGLRGVVLCSGTNGGLYSNRVVFPANQKGGTGANPCTATGTAEPRPPNGTLMFADFTQAQLDCIDPSKPGTVCSGVGKINVVQFALVEAITLYGLTFEDTGNGESVRVPAVESEQAYYFYDSRGYPGSLAIAQAFETYMNAQCGSPWCSISTRSGPTHSLLQWNLTWAGIPNQGGKAFWQHLHLADPCVAEGLQGVAGGCVTAGLPPPPPVGVYYVSPTGNDANNGSSATACGTNCGPWLTILHADNTFVEGTVSTLIHVAAGTYNIGSGISLNRGGSTSSIRTVFQCDPGVASAISAIGQCKLTGTSGIQILGNNVDFVGFDIGGNAAMNFCVSSGKTGTGGGTASPTGNSVHIIGNYCHDLASTVTTTSVIGCPEIGAIQGGASGFLGTGFQVIGNIVLNYGLSYPAAGCLATYGINVGDNPGATIENNIVINVPTGDYHLPMACRAIISNNIGLSSISGLALDDIDKPYCPSTLAGLNTINNNYFGNNSNHIFYVGGRSVCSVTTPNSFGSNFTDGVGADTNLVAPFTCDTFIPSSLTHTAGAVAFTNYLTTALGDLHLPTGSPLAIAGTTTCVAGGPTPCVPVTDAAGNAYSVPPSVGVYTGPAIVAAASVSPTTVNFGVATVGVATPLQTVTFTNGLPFSVTFSAIAKLGADTGVVNISNDLCSTHVVASHGGTCTFQLSITPISGGSLNASLSLTGIGFTAISIPLAANTSSTSITYIQTNSSSPDSATTISATYTTSQTSGNTNIIAIGWNDAISTIVSVTDTQGNTYRLAAPSTTVTSITQAIYYASNIKSGANTVSVTFNKSAAFPDLRIYEYTGLDPINPFDVASSATGASLLADSGQVTTTSSTELLFAAGMTVRAYIGAGASYTSRGITIFGDIGEDRVVTTSGAYNATAPTSVSSTWIFQLATFKAIGGTGGNPTPPTVASVSPATGVVTGGNTVALGGTGFLVGAIVRFGGVTATNVVVSSATAMTVTVPAGALRVVSISVTNTNGTSGTLTNGYTYTPTPIPVSVTSIIPATGDIAGGTVVTIGGTGFLSGATITVGAAATNVVVVNSTTITAKVPAHAVGAVNVTVNNSNGTNGTLINGFTYTTVGGGGGGGGSVVATLAPTSNDFGASNVGVSGNPKTYTLTNTTSASINVTSVLFSGANPTDYSKINDHCTGANVLVAANCTLQVIFTAGGLGLRTATLTVAGNGFITLTSTLQGTGLASTAKVVVNPTSLSFGSITVAAVSTQAVKITNNTVSSVTIGTITSSGDYTLASDLCSTVVLVPTTSCTFSSVFTPSTTGSRTGTITIPGTGFTTLTVPLDGTGITLPLPPSALSAIVN